MSFAFRISHLEPEGAYQVLARSQALEAEGRQIIHLEIGEPDNETFDNIKAAGIRAIAEGKTRYTPPMGMKQLREVIAQQSSLRYQMAIDPDQVVVSPGAKPNLFFPALALIEPGDEVIYPNPGFPTYEAMIRVAGGIPVPVPLVEEKNFSFDLDAFRTLVNRKTKLVILNSPGNPTGGVMPLQDLEAIASIARNYNFWIMSDEIYSRIAYDDMDVPSMVTLPGMMERTIVVDGFSKTYAMTGWRLGYGIMPRELAHKVQLLLTHSVGSTANFVQIAGIEALTGPQDQVKAVIKEYQHRRDVMVDGLNAIPGFKCLRPQGAFYVFPNIRAFGLTSAELADLILEKANVALLPGSSFGKYGEGYLRLVYSNSITNIQMAIQQIGEAVNTLH
ncbi:MAG TPA: pyridoxal phosphate-dependent aminotransferase [Anaerolineales bacterium]|nr:pyridoxal phosphate-dependent aminotransferase [Anaerolineales bacterium]